jgi:catalase (peroxidase I)
VQLEVERLIISKWTVAPSGTGPQVAGYSTCISAMQTSGTLGGCCRIGGATTTGRNDTGRAEILASIVRLSFHDPAPYNVVDGRGGANGCIDFTDPDNAGLEVVVQQMTALQALLNSSTYNISISLADLYQYAGLVATWCALPALPTSSSATVMQLPFRWGRVDAATCDHTKDSGRLPDSEKAFGELYSLAQRWGMTMKDIAALSGAHALGSTKASQSGYSTNKPDCGVGNCGGANVTGQW